ncbi:DUF222 domain-containing protein [Naumannella halotolerans]|uniref:Uncharacterized protein DUF222 n=1 Tax=Naumannella halotolerans TaxID=993414 RepID=A0A4R7J5S7_9ACTN|nr:DUF222 domain-containing protein [Naumannella halotolerans]TDT32525.1 uncharacterized protein DUF222 [Naumannella halotolerans]
MTADHIVAEHAELRAVMLRLRAAQRDQLQAACHWADSHPWLGDLTNPSGVETVSRFAGEGTPEVEPGSVAEFAALLGLSTAGGERLLAEALELRHRLPLLWERVTRLDLSADHARRVAARTMTLSHGAAAWVDRQLVTFAGRVCVSQLERTVEAARRVTGERADSEVFDERHVTIRTGDTRVNAVAEVSAILDAVDGADLEKALQYGAAQQKAWGSAEGLNARRALALGELARRQTPLPAAGGVTPEAASAGTPAPTSASLPPTPGTQPSTPARHSTVVDRSGDAVPVDSGDDMRSPGPHRTHIPNRSRRRCRRRD